MTHSKPTYPNHPKPPMPNDFCRMVREAITDEIGAVAMYATMANLVDNMTLKTLILSIAGDEYGHAKTWIAIDTLMCGSHPHC